MHVEVPVHGQQRQGRRQHGEHCHDQDVGDQCGPREHRHPHQVHAGGAHAQDGHDEVDAGQRRAQPRYLQGPDVVVHPHGWTVLQP
ncbi:hypothetical protein G6F22_022119 [Rhizopus arrhizus]|nr:hypothetical protein G6F22_022119 [Rhizopus arrhizus]